MLDLWLPYLLEEKRVLFLGHRRRIFWGAEGPYEDEKTYPREGDWVLDVGAYVGVFAVLSGKVVGEKGRVFAFEP
ncbi:MAG: hypothetical protein ACUVTO_08860 [Candidatus Caldatribacteriaceae bacterium]